MGYTDKRDRKRKHNFVVKDGVAMRKTEDNNKYNPDPDFIVFGEMVLNNDDVFVDVGAQHGLYTAVANRYLKNSTIYSFEPDDRWYQNLIKIIPKPEHPHWPDNGNEIKTYHLGLGKERCTKKLNTKTRAGRINVDGDMDVEIDSMDNIFKNIPIDFVKIDVEGFEYEVLLGAEEVIKKYKPKFIIETHPKYLEDLGSSEEEVISFMEKHGYTSNLFFVRDDCKVGVKHYYFNHQ